MRTNKQRCGTVNTILACSYDSGDQRSSIIDLLTDLRHLCKRDDIDFEKVLLMSEIHFHDELSEEIK